MKLSRYRLKISLVAGSLIVAYTCFFWAFLRFHPVVLYGEVPRKHPIYQNTGQSGMYPLKYCLIQTKESRQGSPLYVGHFFIASPGDSYWKRTAEIRSEWPWRKADIWIGEDEFFVTAKSLLSETRFRSGSIPVNKKLLIENKYAQIITLPFSDRSIRSSSAVELQEIVQEGLTGEKPPTLWQKLDVLYRKFRL